MPTSTSNVKPTGCATGALSIPTTAADAHPPDVDRGGAFADPLRAPRLGLDLQTAASPVEAAEAPGRRGSHSKAPTVTQRSPASADRPRADVPRHRTAVPLRGQVVSNGARLDVDGQATDLFTLAGIDAKVALRTPSLASLKPWLGKPLPTSPPVEIGGRLTKAPTRCRWPTSQRRSARPASPAPCRMTAARTSALPGRHQQPRGSRRGPALDHGAGARARCCGGRSVSDTPIRAPRQAIGPSPVQPPLRRRRCAAPRPSRRRVPAPGRSPVDRSMAGGIGTRSDRAPRRRLVAVAPLAFGIGSGRASGRFDLDTNRTPAEAQLRSMCAA